MSSGFVNSMVVLGKKDSLLYLRWLHDKSLKMVDDSDMVMTKTWGWVFPNPKRKI
jgi:high-affinity nickel permease